MRRFSFGTFLVDDANRALYETCRAIASLSYRGRLPVLLIAPEGFGKTHLLYSIVNRARSGPAKTGVAFVSADEFPQEVARLTRSPAPVERARNAILLVDDLHKFQRQLDVLDNLVDLFLKHGHYVVLTSRVPLSGLSHLPASLKRRLERGHAFEIGKAAGPAKEVPEDDAFQAPSSLQSELEDLRGKWEATHQDLNQAKQEIEQLRGENALLKVSARELGPLRERLEELQDRVEHSDRQVATQDSTPARQQAGAVLEKAAALLEEVEESRSKLARIREESRTADLRPVLALSPEPAGRTPDSAPPAAQPVAVEERERLEREIEQLRRAVARANEERDETRRHLRAAFEKLDRYEKNMDKLRQQVDQYTNEQDQAVEQRLQALGHSSRLEVTMVSECLRDVQAQFAAGLRMIDRMADQLDALCASLGGPPAAPLPEADTFFVAPAEEESPTQPEPVKVHSESTEFVPGIGTKSTKPTRAEPESRGRHDDEGWSPRKSLHHIEELTEPGLIFYPEDSSI